MREITSLQILEILKEIRKYYEQFSANKFDNSDETEIPWNTNYQSSLEKKQITWRALYLLNKSNLWPKTFNKKTTGPNDFSGEF